MSEKPIIFSGPMVRAIMDGRKKQTRRIKFTCQPGDMLWVRETWNACPVYEIDEGYEAGYPYDVIPKEKPRNALVSYRADDPGMDGPWRPSIYMPKWAARINLIVKNVRIERIQAITKEDVSLEGVLLGRDSFEYLWNHLNKKRGYGWDVNPLVKVIQFEVVK